MSRSLKIVTLIFVGFVFLLLLKKPLEYWLSTFSGDEKFNHFLSGSVVRGIIVIILLVIIRRFNLTTINGLSSPLSFLNVQAFLLPLMIVGAGIWSNVDTYRETGDSLLIVFLTNAVLVGFAEELVFRGVVLSLLIRSTIGHSNILFAILISSALFGLTHYINLFRQPENVAGITSQVIFAFCIGTFFAGLFLRTGNIISVAIIHSLVNLGFGAGELTEQRHISHTTSAAATTTDWASIVVTLIIFGFILISGLVMAHFSDKSAIIKKLGDTMTL